MNRFLLDTNVPSELTKPRSDPGGVQWLEDANDERLFLSVISLGELTKGLITLPLGRRRHELNEWLRLTLRPWFGGRILPVDEAIAERWGVLSGQLQMGGRGVGMADGLIAATALEHDLTLVTRNVRHFQVMGLEIINPYRLEPGAFR